MKLICSLLFAGLVACTAFSSANAFDPKTHYKDPAGNIQPIWTEEVRLALEREKGFSYSFLEKMHVVHRDYCQRFFSHIKDHVHRQKVYPLTNGGRKGMLYLQAYDCFNTSNIGFNSDTSRFMRKN